jgi:hypothetical protein
VQVIRNSVDTQNGPADWFTGDVYIDAVATPEATSTRTEGVAGERHFPAPTRAREASP